MKRLFPLFLLAVASSVGRLPWVVQSQLIRILEFLTLAVAKKDIERLYRNVAAVYGLPRHTSFARMFARQVVRHQLSAVFDLFTVLANPDRITFDGLEDVSRTLREVEHQGQGMIVVTAHVGSWEFCAHIVARAIKGTFHVLAKPAKHTSLTGLLDGVRTRLGGQVLWTDRRSILREMLGALKTGDALGFVMDQKPEGRRGHMVPFFGVDTAFVSGPAAVAARTGAPVFAIFCLRAGKRHYRILLEQMTVADEAERLGEEGLTRQLAARIESVIRVYPEQWTWNYKRWTTDELSRLAGLTREKVMVQSPPLAFGSSHPIANRNDL